MLQTTRNLVTRLIRISLFFFTLIVTLPALSADWLSDYANYVQREAAKYNVPGYTFVYYEQGKAPQVYVYGRTHKGGKRITEDTVFRLASVSVSYTHLTLPTNREV